MDTLHNYGKRKSTDDAMDIIGRLQSGLSFIPYSWASRSIRPVSDEAYLMACQFCNIKPSGNIPDNPYMRWHRLEVVGWAKMMLDHHAEMREKIPLEKWERFKAVQERYAR